MPIGHGKPKEAPILPDDQTDTGILLDVYFDFVCPWCYIGRHRLQRALDARRGIAVSVRWQPFQLNPGMPQGGMDRRSYLIAKFGSMERLTHVKRLVRLAADGDNLPIAQDKIERTPNSLNAHRLLRYLTARGHRSETVVDRLFAAFMVDGQDIGSPTILAEIASEFREDSAAILDYLNGNRDISVIRARDLAARRMGIQAVPSFVFNRRFALSGAQEPAAFFPFLDHPDIYDTEDLKSGRSEIRIEDGTL